ncbi:MAG: hypothetical protein WA510_05450 [Acidobacteriaceae bacterium]
MSIDSPGTTASLTDEERKAIQEQLERLLNNSHFKHSRRFPSFLRFIVGRTLLGQTDMLKERTLGMEIFGREADYDTASDPIVRVTATEIRKRIAQYYQEPGHEKELRVSLPAGSYIPQFHWPPAAPENGLSGTAILPDQTLLLGREKVEVEVKPPRWRRWFWQPIGIIVAVVVLCAAGVFLWRSHQRSPFEFFWGPPVRSGDPVLFCVADQSHYSTITLRDAADPSRQTQLQDNRTAIIFDDLNPIVRVAGLFQSNGKKYVVKGESGTDLADLRNGPTVFIGAFNNAWTLRLTAPLRYHFANNPEMTEFSIVDSTKAGQPGWVVNRPQQMSTNNYRDFAIVARFTDGTTGKLAVVAAGVAHGGTAVAAEYLTDPGDLAQLERMADGKKNMEVVLSTQIIDGEPGKPKLEASYFW